MGSAGRLDWRERLRMFFILQWKNLILKRRHWVLTTVEILVPTLLFATLVAIRVEGGDEVIRTLKRCSKHQSVMRGTVRNIVSFLS